MVCGAGCVMGNHSRIVRWPGRVAACALRVGRVGVALKAQPPEGEPLGKLTQVSIRARF